MMLRGKDDILHPRLARLARPQARVEQVRVKIPKIRFIPLVRNFFMMLHPFMPRGGGIKPPMDEHAEPGPDKPVHVALNSRRLRKLNHKYPFLNPVSGLVRVLTFLTITPAAITGTLIPP
ncbi:MAG: hypothetical protein BWX80_03670 [Candidatus Hydrogenedentes bacterium ADurb.Bin101]|nr:MAG: hypothetical protein BWX80_03670 [Candidatus Hydrogenedentes bacterium ADurb.Bin101]